MGQTRANSGGAGITYIKVNACRSYIITLPSVKNNAFSYFGRSDFKSLVNITVAAVDLAPLKRASRVSDFRGMT